MKSDIKKDLMDVLKKHGMTKIPDELQEELTKKPGIPNIGSKASYIKEIITDKNAYDEKILAKVGEALKSFQK